MSSKPGETSVKWQLCYDVTAKMWWMVSGAAGVRGRPGTRRSRSGLSDSGTPGHGVEGQAELRLCHPSRAVCKTGSGGHEGGN